ncbi:MAG: XisI protein [Caldilineaceae bacterium]|nr:XisI protein [Caldilineaceae bacterium]
MDRVESYRKLLKELMSQHAERMNRRPQPDMETEVTFDEERDHYMLLRMGWTSKGRLFVPTLYARIRDGKIWIENDWTSDGLATELMEHGVPAEDIVLAFHPPEIREHTEFAVA